MLEIPDPPPGTVALAKTDGGVAWSVVTDSVAVKELKGIATTSKNVVIDLDGNPPVPSTAPKSHT